MNITIAERLKPFSHLPAASCVIPWSSWKVQAFPTLLKFEHLETFQKLEYRLDWKGPVADFTLELDLEKGVVWIYGRTADGYRRLFVEMTPEGIVVVFDKEKRKEVIPASGFLAPHSLERLSLGKSKALDWELVHRRSDLAEIFPVWFRLGQMVPEKGEKVGAAMLLQEYEKLEIVAAYRKLFLAGFEGILTPRLSDAEHQGVIAEETFSGSPLILLAQGARYIRSFFFREIPQQWAFLPCLPPEFHSGRLIGVQTERGDRIDMEWSKKTLRRLIIHPATSHSILIALPKPLKSFRLRTSSKEKGSRQQIEQPLHLEAGRTVFLDRFEK